MIIIPMAGASRRFFEAGYAQPKYQLMLSGKTMFERVVNSFERYFGSEPFLFIVRDTHGAPRFVEQELRRSAIADHRMVVLGEDTRGQADTIYRALGHVPDDAPMYIFNIDTIRHGYTKPDFVDQVDGYLEVFKGEGHHWSFVQAGAGNAVLRAVEKQRISELCSDGLYYFRSKEIFRWCHETALRADGAPAAELYIAPLYNPMIAAGMDVRYDLIDIGVLDFCGTPAEYQQLLLKMKG